MNSSKPLSLNRQVLIPLVGACLVAAIAVTALSQWLAARHAAAQSRARLSLVADTLADTAFPITASVLEILQSLSGLEIIVCDARGDLRGMTSAIDTAEAAEVLKQLQPGRADEPLNNQSHQLSAGKQLSIGGQSYRATTFYRASSVDSLLVLLEPQAERETIRQQLALMPLLTGLTTLILVGVIALVVSQRLVRRIADLQHQVHGIATGRTQRVTLNGPRDQLFTLAESVNSMADELRSMWRTIRETERSRLLSQVASGLAHQLRNALTGIHLAVQLHRRDCPLGNQESLGVAESELARTAEYIQQLLHSAAGNAQRAQAGTVSEVLNEAQSLLQTIAAHRRIPLAWSRDASAESVIVADRELLRSAVMNLVLNALDAAGPTGQASVHVLKAEGFTKLQVRDSGPGPNAEISEHLFDPFISSKPEGLGVGLTVVRSAAQAFQGQVRWFREKDRTIFELAIPFSASASVGSRAIERRD